MAVRCCDPGEASRFESITIRECEAAGVVCRPRCGRGPGGAGYLVRQRMFLLALSRVAEVTAAMFDLSGKDAAAGVTEMGLSEVVAIPEPTLRRESRWSDAVERLWRVRLRG